LVMGQPVIARTHTWKPAPTTIETKLNPVQKGLLALGILLSVVLFVATADVAGWVESILLLVGISLGVTLLHARFGFTSAFRRLMSVGNVQGLQAHMLMFAVASTLFAIILGFGFSFTGVKPVGFVSPIGVSLVAGSFMFGIGMQLGNGCASGTLYSLGGGSSTMILTLAAFIFGSVLGAYNWDFWMNDMPSLPPVSIATSTGLGYFGAWLVQMIAFGLIYWISVQISKKKNPPRMKQLPTTSGWKKVFRGSWSLFAAAIILAVLNALTLTLRGTPWGITSAFALWGSKILMGLGVHVEHWSFWAGPKAAPLFHSILADSTSVMDIGIILGAFLAAASQGTFKPGKIKSGIAASSILGGFLMGYGSRLAFGCNIGAYFSGIASFSLHGWIWAIMAMLGTYAALFLRPLFGLKNPKQNDSIC
jgi:uncharacterized membrane protein YedE/YeeE